MPAKIASASGKRVFKVDSEPVRASSSEERET